MPEKNTRLHYFTMALIVATSLFCIVYVAAKSNYLSYHKRVLEILSNDLLVRIGVFPADTTLDFAIVNLQHLDSFYTDDLNYSYITDSSGFIVNDNRIGAASLRIAFLGGSEILCLRVNDTCRIASVVEKIIASSTQQKCFAWNCAGESQNSFYALNVLLTEIIHRKPDYVFLSGSICDVYTLINDGQFAKRQSANSIFFNLSQVLSTQTQSGNTSSSKDFSHFENEVSSSFEFPVDSSCFQFDSATFESQVTRLFSTFLEICMVNEIKPVVIVPTNNFARVNYNWLLKNSPQIKVTKLQYEQFGKAVKLYQNCISQAATTKQVQIIDLNTAALKLSDFCDPIHFNNAGAKKASVQIAEEFFRQNKSILQPSSSLQTKAEL